MLTEQQKQLVEKNMGLVHYIVDKYFKNNFNYINREELIQEGMYSLCRCTQYYKDDLGKYSSYVCKCIKTHLTEYVVKYYNKNLETVEYEDCKNEGYSDRYNFDTSDEMKDFIYKYIRKEKKADMIVDYYFNNMSWEEVAQKYGYANRKAACAICQNELKKLGNNTYLKNKLIELFV